jgi:hypothetical protein
MIHDLQIESSIMNIEMEIKTSKCDELKVNNIQQKRSSGRKSCPKRRTIYARIK